MGASHSQKGVELEERDFFKDVLSEQELRNLLGDTPPTDVFSWRSPSFKKLGLEKDSLTDDDMIRHMLEEPRLIRRPLVEVNGRLIVGTDKKAMAEAFPE